jgi:uncharacterized membrane protein HdeD (DUF308 family)
MTGDSPSPIEALPRVAEHTLEAHWRFFLWEGAALLVLGAGAGLLPLLVRLGVANYWIIAQGQLMPVQAYANLEITILFGWLLIASGVAGFATTCIGRHAPGFVWSLLSSLVAGAAGVVLFWQPGGGVLPLAWVLTAFLAFDGLVTVMLARDYHRAGHRRWYLLLVSGLVDVVLAGALAVQLPATASWMVGPILGVDFLFAGISLIGLSLAARDEASLRQAGI